MAKHTSKTRVVINGVDVSRDVLAVTLPRVPGDVDMVVLTMAVSALSVEPDDTLYIHIETGEA